MSARALAVVSVLCLAGAAFLVGCAEPGNKDGERAFRDSFPVDKGNLSDLGVNEFFLPLTPGYRLTLVSEDGKETVTVTVLDETKVVDGVKTRVIEEREMKRGRLAEVSRNHFAIDKTTRDVYYFGEEVDIYKGGKVVGHGGSWLSGVDGGRFGLMMPGRPQVGDRYYQEMAGNARDRGEIVSVTDTVETPAGTFTGCVRVRESSALEEESEDKWFAPGVGLVRDAELVLSKIEKPEGEAKPAGK